MNSATEDYRFDRPVVILAAPRSGSTLLFETLTTSADFWTIGGESHGVFESIRQFNPQSGLCNSNELSAADASDEIISQIRASFFSQLRNSCGERYRGSGESDRTLPRLLEKTPKNAVRVSLLDAIFPDALFIYLYRNPRENISSMIDAWHSGRFVTYRNLPGRQHPWSLLLPRGWEEHHQSSVAQTAAFQWQAANTSILQNLGRLDRSRWIAVSYGQQVNEPITTFQRLCSFCDVSPERILDRVNENGLKLSRYTLSKPAADKWHKNAGAIAPWLPGLADTIQFIQGLAPDLPEAEFDLGVDPALLSGKSDGGSEQRPPDQHAGRRNAPCYCGSGKRFKHCHGDPNHVGALP